MDTSRDQRDQRNRYGRRGRQAGRGAPPALELSGVTKVYNLGGTRIVALDNVDLTVENEEVVILLGPSGSGKTTLLSLAGGLLSPSSGRVRVAGMDISRASRRKRTRFRRQHVGFIFQGVNLVPFLTARENLLIAAELAKRDRSAARKRADQLLEELGLKHRAKNVPGQLSGGERQRVGIARALMNAPRLVLVDEPTSALDSKLGEQVMDLIVSKVKSRGAAAVVVTHDQRMARYGDRVLQMGDGKILAAMSPGALNGQHSGQLPLASGAMPVAALPPGEPGYATDPLAPAASAGMPQRALGPPPWAAATSSATMAGQGAALPPVESVTGPIHDGQFMDPNRIRRSDLGNELPVRRPAESVDKFDPSWRSPGGPRPRTAPPAGLPSARPHPQDTGARQPAAGYGQPAGAPDGDQIWPGEWWTREPRALPSGERNGGWETPPWAEQTQAAQRDGPPEPDPRSNRGHHAEPDDRRERPIQSRPFQRPQLIQPQQAFGQPVDPGQVQHWSSPGTGEQPHVGVDPAEWAGRDPYRTDPRPSQQHRAVNADRADMARRPAGRRDPYRADPRPSQQGRAVGSGPRQSAPRPPVGDHRAYGDHGAYGGDAERPPSSYGYDGSLSGNGHVSGSWPIRPAQRQARPPRSRRPGPRPAAPPEAGNGHISGEWPAQSDESRARRGGMAMPTSAEIRSGIGRPAPADPEARPDRPGRPGTRRGRPLPRRRFE